MVIPVPQEDLPAVAEIQPQKSTGQKHHNAADPGREIIAHIVHSGRDKAHILIGRLHIAQHGVHGVHRLVGKGQGAAAQGEIEHRGDHTVRTVLRHSLHRRPGDGIRVQGLGIPAYDHGNGIAGILDGAGFQRLIDLHALLPQALGRQHLPAENRLQQKPQPGTDHPRQLQKPPGDQKAHGHSHKPDAAPGQILPQLCFGKQGPESLFQPGNQLTHAHHRVGNGPRVSQQAVQKESQQHGAEKLMLHGCPSPER